MRLLCFLSVLSAASILLFLACQIAHAANAETVPLLTRDTADSASLVLHDYVIVCTVDGTIYALDAVFGTLKWILPSEEPLFRSSVSDFNVQGSSEAGHAFIPSIDGGIYIFTPDRGVQKLPVSVRDIVSHSPFIDNTHQQLYVGSKRTKIYAIDVATGKLASVFTATDSPLDSEHDCPTGPLGDTAGLLYVGRSDYTVRGIDLRTGTERWNVTIGEFLATARSAHSLFASIAAVDDVDTGRPRPTPTPAAADVIAGGLDGAVYYIDAATGRPRWVHNPAKADAESTTSATPLGMTPAAIYRLARMANAAAPAYVIDNANVSLILMLPRSTAALFRYSPNGAVDTPHESDVFLGNTAGGGMFAIDAARLLVVDEVDMASRLLPSGVESEWSVVPATPPQAAEPRLPALPSGSEKSSDVPWRLPAYHNATAADGAGGGVALAAAAVAVAGAVAAFAIGWWRGTKRSPTKPTANKGKRPHGGKPAAKKGKSSAAIQRTATPKPSKSDGEPTAASEAPKQPSAEPVDMVDSRAAGPSEPPATLRVGRLRIHRDRVLGYGSGGTVVFEGALDGRRVAVKRLLRQFYEVADKEVGIFLESDEHANVVRYYAREDDGVFVYIALSLCIMTLEDLIEGGRKPAAGSGGSAVAGATPIAVQRQPVPPVALDDHARIRIMLEMARGVAHLHSLNIVHRDLKPQNILLDAKLSVKISDMGLAKKLDGNRSSFSTLNAGTRGWQAPELLELEGAATDAVRMTKKVDVFSLGCLMYYVLTSAAHPFGERYEREVNILHGRSNTSLLRSRGWPLAEDLITAMLARDPNDRPSVADVLVHPLFWPEQKQLLFLKDASDRLEIEKATVPMVVELEGYAEELFGTPAKADAAAVLDWSAKLDAALLSELGKYRKYKTSNVRDLLRLIRNKSHHYRDLSPAVQQLLGDMPGGFLRYFTSRFPRLFVVVHRVIRKHCSTEPAFMSYFAMPGGEL